MQPSASAAGAGLLGHAPPGLPVAGPPLPQPQPAKRARVRRVSWSSALTQVRLFLAEDAPVLAGVTQHLLQQKQKLLVESLPPGFGKPSLGSGVANTVAQTTAAVAWRVPNMVSDSPACFLRSGCTYFVSPSWRQAALTLAVLRRASATLAWRRGLALVNQVALEAEWMVAAGDQSDEARLQREREQRIFEAPRRAGGGPGATGRHCDADYQPRAD
eukprot:SM000010S04195  [mRNA]  locus=s10:151957:152969:- [translate_table: standard]